MKTEKCFNYLTFTLLVATSVFMTSCDKDDDNNDSQQKSPTLTTLEVTEISQTTAISGGNITDDGGADVTVRGVCWSTNQSPTISDNKTENGSGSGQFTSNLIDLQPNTTYYVRAYATNSAGTGYGNSISFVTLEAIVTPVLSTLEITEITQTTAISGGNITDDGGADVTARGVCWSTNQSPTISDNKTENGSGSGQFTSNLIDLQPNTTYYVRAYATNSEGTGYGNAIEFQTLEEVTTVTDIDGNVYNTIIIGTQEWMTANLKTTKFNDGTLIPHVTENNEWIELTSGAYCWYDNNESTYGSVYGALYNWYAVNSGNLCPTGWHVPTDEEWTILVNYAGGENTAGLKLKATSGWYNNGNGNDNYGFSAKPGGFRNHYDGTYSDDGINGNWWSSTQDDPVFAWYRFMYYGYDKVTRISFRKKNGFSVRCLKD